MKFLSRPLYLALGWLCVGLGIIGVVLPVFPTTPFLIVALWAFTRSSPHLAEKLRNHTIVGPYLRAWQDHGVIPKRAKFLAVLAMSGSLIGMALFSILPVFAIAAIAAIMASVAIYVISRPSKPPKQ